MKKKPIIAPLETWAELNKVLMQTTDEDYLNALLGEEQFGRARKQFLRRIHSRLNKVRADREREELGRVGQ